MELQWVPVATIDLAIFSSSVVEGYLVTQGQLMLMLIYIYIYIFIYIYIYIYICVCIHITRQQGILWNLRLMSRVGG